MKKTKWIKIGIFLTVLYVPWVLWYGVGHVCPQLRERFTFELLENRNIYDLEDGFENFYNDRIPFRTWLVRNYNRSVKWLDATYKDGAEKVLISLLYDGEDSYFPPNITANRVIHGREDWLYQTDYEDYADYRGTDLLTEEQLLERKKAFEDLQVECERQGKEFLVLTLPSKLNVYDEYMPTIEVINEYKRLPRLRDWMKENSTVHMVCPWDELRDMKQYYPTYYRYDNHWNSFGGYIGAQEVYKELGYELTPLQDLDIRYHTEEETTWKGLIGFGGFDPSDFTIPDYDIDINYRPEVTTAIDPSTWWVFYEFTSDGPIDKHLTLIGDSFREAIDPFFYKDFTRYSSILQYGWAQSYCEEQGIDYDEVMRRMKEDILDADIIILEATESNEDVQFEYAKLILEVLKEGK